MSGNQTNRIYKKNPKINLKNQAGDRSDFPFNRIIAGNQYEKINTGNRCGFTEEINK